MAKRQPPKTNGVVIVDKPAGVTSHDVVARLRRIYGERRVGHGGTLDPAATGVLVIGVGWATRLLNYFQHDTKRYTGVVSFGTATDTLDADGAVVATSMGVDYDRDAVSGALAQFRGQIEQVPPMVSAIRVGGERLYEKARRGEVVEREARAVTIESLELLDFDAGPPATATLDVICSAGTYIRVLAADIGQALGGYAHLASLRRTEASGFTLNGAHRLEQVECDPAASLLTPVEAVGQMGRIEVSENHAQKLRMGQRLALAEYPGLGGGPIAALVKGEFVGIVEVVNDAVRPVLVWPTAVS